MTGQRFGRLFVLEYAGKGRQDKALWKCICDCGSVINAVGISLRSGKTRSCGCLIVDWCKKTKRTHGKSTSRTYKSWSCMINRCTNPSYRAYHRYGGRGITFDPKWKTFAGFLQDMGERPEKKSLDRIDNNGHYYKENCKWSTQTEQCRNRCNSPKYQGQRPV